MRDCMWGSTSMTGGLTEAQITADLNMDLANAPPSSSFYSVSGIWNSVGMMLLCMHVCMNVLRLSGYVQR
jgi:hypothetical protein